MSSIEIPEKIKIARDIDLIDGKDIGLVTIIIIEKMNQNNWKDLVIFTPTVFGKDAQQYFCDICKKKCGMRNPIYTSKEYAGVDVCTKCIKNALNYVPPLPGWSPGPVYSLKEIAKYAQTKEIPICGTCHQK